MAKAEESRHVPDGWELSLLEAVEIRALASPDVFEATASDLIEAMQVESKEKPGSKWVGETLGKYNLFAKKARVKRAGKKVTTYSFHRCRVLQIVEIFLRGNPQNDLSHLSPDEKNKEDNGLSGTDQKTGTCPHVSPLLSGKGNGKDRPGHVHTEGHVPKELFKNIIENTEETEGTVPPRGDQEKNIHLFSSEEVDL